MHRASTSADMYMRILVKQASLCARRFVFEQPIQVARLVRDLADRAQVATQRSWKRPYGVGVLAAGHDKTGAHLFYNCPSGAYYDYKAMAIGARSQVRCRMHW